MGKSETCFYLLGLGLGYWIGHNNNDKMDFYERNRYNRIIEIKSNKINNYNKFIKYNRLEQEYKSYNQNTINNTDLEQEYD